MSTETTLQILSTSSAATEQIGSRLGTHLKGGEVISLVSDLGGGKTTFVRGLARGIGSTDHVASPTFTIKRLYKSPELSLHHFDFFRLPDAGIIRHELVEILDDQKAVTVIEWGETVSDLLPQNRLIKIEIAPNNDDSRRIIFSFPKVLEYLTENLK